MRSMNLRILSVNIGRARVIGQLHGADVWSGIAKKPVADDSVFVGRLDIEGDAQADLSVHGGADKAVYAYPADHWPWWEREKSFGCGPASFGENLTLEGGDEHAVAIGDRFRWGDALLEVSQPRAPCYKLAIHARRDIPQLMTVSARCGWYFRVIEEGTARVRDAALECVTRSNSPSVYETFVALFGRGNSREALLRIRDTPQLAESWRHAVAAKIDAARG
jgi:MOSC domain-containing protein YiiM